MEEFKPVGILTDYEINTLSFSIRTKTFDATWVKIRRNIFTGIYSIGLSESY